MPKTPQSAESKSAVPRLLALDLDGTTVNRQGNLGEKTKAALLAARERDIWWYLPPAGGILTCSPSGKKVCMRTSCC